MIADLRQREPRERSKAYLAWLHTCPCVVCASTGATRREVQAAHVRFADAEAGWRSTGMAEKPNDLRAVPLCAAHHLNGGRRQNGQHGHNERLWWERQGLNIFQLVADLNGAFDQGLPGYIVIARHAGRARRDPWTDQSC